MPTRSSPRPGPVGVARISGGHAVRADRGDHRSVRCEVHGGFPAAGCTGVDVPVGLPAPRWCVLGGGGGDRGPPGRGARTRRHSCFLMTRSARSCGERPERAAHAAPVTSDRRGWVEVVTVPEQGSAGTRAAAGRSFTRNSCSWRLSERGIGVLAVSSGCTRTGSTSSEHLRIVMGRLRANGAAKRRPAVVVSNDRAHATAERLGQGGGHCGAVGEYHGTRIRISGSRRT